MRNIGVYLGSVCCLFVGGVLRTTGTGQKRVKLVFFFSVQLQGWNSGSQAQQPAQLPTRHLTGPKFKCSASFSKAAQSIQTGLLGACRPGFESDEPVDSRQNHITFKITFNANCCKMLFWNRYFCWFVFYASVKEERTECGRKEDPNDGDIFWDGRSSPMLLVFCIMFTVNVFLQYAVYFSVM